MIKFKYRYCKVHLARYVSGDLSDPVLRRVARYIDECEDCYREYLRHREFAAKLERNLPTLGRPDSGRLDHVWSSLQAELQAPSPRRSLLSDFGAPSSTQFGYGIVMLAISLALLLPIVIGYHPALTSIDLPRRPYVARIVTTPSTDFLNALIPIGATQSIKRNSAPLLQNTPSPRL